MKFPTALECLATRSLFFKGSPLFISWVPFHGHWIRNGLIMWIALSVISLFLWPWLARLIFGPRDDE